MSGVPLSGQLGRQARAASSLLAVVAPALWGIEASPPRIWAT